MEPDIGENPFVKFISKDMTNGKIFYRKCRGMAKKFGLTPEETEDAYQEFALGIMKRDPIYNPQIGTIDGFLYVCFVNTCHDQGRRQARNSVSIYAINKETDKEFTIEPKSYQPTPQEILSKRERIQGLHEAINKLPQKRRELIELKLEGMSCREISNNTSTKKSTVKSRLHSAKHTLRKLLTEDIQ